MGVSGVASVTISRRGPKVPVRVSPDALAARGLTVHRRARRIGRPEGLRGAGFSSNDASGLTLRAEGQGRSGSQLGGPLVHPDRRTPGRLRDVARFVEGAPPRRRRLKSNDTPGVVLGFHGRSTRTRLRRRRVRGWSWRGSARLLERQGDHLTPSQSPATS